MIPVSLISALEGRDIIERMSVDPIGFSSSDDGWNHLRQAVYEPVSEATARRRHRDGKRYSAILDVDGTLVVVWVQLSSAGDGGAGVQRWDDTRTVPASRTDLRVVDDALFVVAGGRRNGGTRTVPDELLVADQFRWVADRSGERLNQGAAADWIRFDGDHRAGVLMGALDDFDPAPHRFDIPDPGAYGALLDPSLPDRLWPGLPPLPWIGP